MLQRHDFRYMALVSAVAAAYFAAGKVGLSLAFLNPSASAVWPPAGIALAALLIFGRRVWPGILIGAFLVNVTTAGGIATSLGIAIGNTLEAVAGSALTRRIARGGHVFQQPSHIFQFAGLVGGLSTMVSATIGVVALALGGLAPWSRFGSIWLTWWLGDAAGVLVLAPFLVLWSFRPRSDWKPGELVEGALMLVSLGLVGLFVFTGFSPWAHKNYPLEFLCFPVLAWLAFRFTQRAAATAAVLLSVIAIAGTVHGHGPFHRATPHESLLLLQAFLAVITTMMLAVTAGTAERKRHERAILGLNQDLEERVARRTRQLGDANEQLRTQIGERERAQRELEKSEARLREAQQVARVGSWEWDVEQNRVWWSEELFSLYGLDPGAFGASYEAFLERVHPADRTIVHREIQAAMERPGPFTFEHRIVRPDGSTLTLLAQGHTVVDPEGRPIRMSGTGQDITERKRAEEHRVSLIQEQAARREAEEANRMKDEFLATLSHELRTPLNAIVGWAEVLRDGQLDGAARVRAIETISRNALIQNQLISDILDSTRMALGRLDLVKQPVDLATVIESGLETMKPAALAKSVRLESNLKDVVSPMMGDPDRLQQVVWNLVSNAIKFAPEGGWVGVTLVTDGETSRLRVEDDGPGIEPKLLPYIFDRFRQGDSSSTRRHSGLGLGLAIVRHLVELHGGTVAAANRDPGPGAQLTVTLPLTRIAVQPLTDDRLQGRGAGVPAGSDGFLRGVRVLVAEDDRDSRDVMGTLMSGLGAEVLAADSAAEAFDLVRSRRPHLLISDIEMPGENGYDLIARVRALPEDQGGRTPAIALTAYAGAENASRALRSGYQGHLAKPVSLEKLVAMVGSVVGERSTRGASRSSAGLRSPDR